MIATKQDARELSLQELDIVAGGGLASPTGSIIIFGYGIQWNDRSICIVTPTQDTIINRPR
ncbi:MAG: hypothetical protein ACREEK_12115 [Bradyrhizobium sp.]